MDKRLTDVINGNEDNYLFPFYWQQGNHTEKIPAQIKEIYDSGCRGLCVESRTHEDFGGEGWWRDMDIILSECKKRNMQVWVLDDKHFPTGYANGQIKKHPELRQRLLIEKHIDVIGPMEGASVIVPADGDDILLGAYAYRRTGEDENIDISPIPLTENIKNNFLYWDIPKGCYRIFFLYKSYRGGRGDYIDMISEESARLQLEAVYKPHYEHYKEYFGNTLAGFFSDEPSFGNEKVGRSRVDRGFYEKRIGTPGLALPFNEALLSMMSEELGEDALKYFGELWYESEHSHLTRLAYMNAVTRLYESCFCKMLGDWCREHGVIYVGHIIEDMNAHGRMGCSAGHYFRSLSGQDMSGIDIVLHQVMPGMGGYITAASTSGGLADPEFYHYVLAKLGASAAHLYPHMKGRAMCEVFGAYGWGEGSPMYKWLIDFLLVRGINRFVPHAFSPSFPNGDCPPHFGAEGHDPQYDGFSAIMRYTGKAAHLLSGGVHIAPAAILYHAEGEWMNPYGEAMLTEKPAKALYDRQIDFDIVCCDMLKAAEVRNNRLVIGEEAFAALVVPYAKHLPKELVSRLNELSDLGLPVIYADALPDGVKGTALPVSSLADYFAENGFCDIKLEGDYPFLRVFHIKREGNDVFMLFNESPDTAAETVLLTDAAGDYAELRLIEDIMTRRHTVDGRVKINLLPGQSEIIVFGECNELPEEIPTDKERTLTPDFKIELAESDDLSKFKAYKTTDKLVSITGAAELPEFSGKMRYSFSENIDGPCSRCVLSLGKVGQTARLFVNGHYAGIRVSPPYRFDIEKYILPGENHFEIEVANTLGNKIRDYFTHFLQLPPSGLLGPVKLLYK